MKTALSTVGLAAAFWMWALPSHGRDACDDQHYSTANQDQCEWQIVKVRVRVAGKRHWVEARVPIDLDVATARAIVIEGFNLGQATTPVVSCHAPNGPQEPLGDRWVEGFLKHDEPLEISVADDGSELFLAGPSIVLTFEKVDANAGPRYEFRCWGDRVIVTA